MRNYERRAVVDRDRSTRHASKPVVKGTRITVELIVEKLAAGETVEQLLAAPLHLTEAGVQAALASWTLT
jgi:uncharacterized protein (DUF433 family)